MLVELLLVLVDELGTFCHLGGVNFGTFGTLPEPTVV